MAFNSISTIHIGVAAETRHEVDLLSERVKDLRGEIENLHGKFDVLPKLINSFESSIDEQIGRTIKIISILQTSGDSFTDAKVNKVFHDIQVNSAKTQREFDNRYRQASEDSLKEISDGARNSIYHHVAKPVSEFIQEQKYNIWKTYGICFVCALVGALVFSLVAAPPKYTKEEKLQLQWGEKLAKAWDKVDKKTRDLIESQ